MRFVSLLCRTVAPCLFCLLGSPLRAADTTPPTPPDVPTSDAPTTDEPVRDALVDQTTLVEAIAEVHDLLQMSAPMELEYEDGVDPVVEAFDLGLIVEVSLEQVEAALAAAALTPEIEDDQAALLLKHRGSYRYFCGEITMEPTPPEDSPSIEPGSEAANPNN